MKIYFIRFICFFIVYIDNFFAVKLLKNEGDNSKVKIQYSREYYQYRHQRLSFKDFKDFIILQKRQFQKRKNEIAEIFGLFLQKHNQEVKKASNKDIEKMFKGYNYLEKRFVFVGKEKEYLMTLKDTIKVVTITQKLKKYKYEHKKSVETVFYWMSVYYYQKICEQEKLKNHYK